MKLLIIALQMIVFPVVALGMDDNEEEFLREDNVIQNDINQLNAMYWKDTAQKIRDSVYEEPYVEPETFISYSDEYYRKKKRWAILKKIFCCGCRSRSNCDKN